MPQYIIYRRKGNKTVLIGLIPNLANIRRAWGWFKKNHKRKVHIGWEYHIYPINHSRYWKHKDGKWLIGSWYGNHKNKSI